MKKEDALICPQCGGMINRATYTCEYCGTKFKEDYQILKVIEEKQKVHILTAGFNIDDEIFYSIGAEKASEMALHEIARKMSEVIMPEIEIRTERDLIYPSHNIIGRLRVVDPNYRF